MASIVDITDIVVAFGAKDELSTLSGPGSTIGSILFEVLWSDGYQEYIFPDEEDINWVIRGDQAHRFQVSGSRNRDLAVNNIYSDLFIGEGEVTVSITATIGTTIEYSKDIVLSTQPSPPGFQIPEIDDPFVPSIDIDTISNGYDSEYWSRVGGTFYFSDGMGGIVSGGGDFDGDGEADYLIGLTRNDLNPQYNVFDPTQVLYIKTQVDRSVPPGVFDGEYMNFDAGTVLVGPTGGIGQEVYGQAQFIGDINNDGRDDIAFFNPSRISDLPARIVFGTDATGLQAYDDPSLGSVSATILQDGFYFTDVCNLGDINGDGIDDVLFNLINDGGSAFLKYGYIVFGRDGLNAWSNFTIDIDNPMLGEAVRIDSTTPNAQYKDIRINIHPGDFDGDGINDLIVYEGSTDNARIIKGGGAIAQTSVIDLSLADIGIPTVDIVPPQTVPYADPAWGIDPDNIIDIDFVGDVNGDGKDDISVSFGPMNTIDPDDTGAIYDGDGFLLTTFNPGLIYVAFGNQFNGNQSALNLDTIDGTNGFHTSGQNSDDTLFYAQPAGDVNGDGIEDLLLSIEQEDGPKGENSGAFQVLYGHPGIGARGIIDLDTLSFADGFSLYGPQAGLGAQNLGEAQNYWDRYVWTQDAKAIGDVDGDGYDDLLIGYPDYEIPHPETPNTVLKVGAAYIVYGRPTPIYQIFPATMDVDENTNGVNLGALHLFMPNATTGLGMEQVNASNYQIIDDPMQAFEIVDENSEQVLKLRDGSAADFENAKYYTVTIQAQLDGGAVISDRVMIAISNQPITDIAMSSGGMVLENAASGTMVATFEASENPVEPMANFSLVDDAGGRFVLDGNELKVAAGAVIDYELVTAHTVRISATDGSGAAYEEDFVIQVTNMPISDITVSSGGSVLENVASGTVVASFQAQENGFDTAAAFTLIDDAGGLFVLDGNELKVAVGAVLDYESATSHTVTVSASDGTNPAHVEDFTIQILDVPGLVIDAGDDGETLDGTDEADVINGNGGNDVINGFGDDDNLYGGDGNDTIDGGPGSDQVMGEAGDDVLIGDSAGGLGSDTLDGGEGDDTALYALDRNAIDQDLQEDGSVTVARPGGGTDTLIDIERIDLLDGDYVFDVGSDNLGFGYRVYQASFGRTPDEGGVRFWIGVLDTLDSWGYSTYAKQQYVASEFIGSDEFRSLYGANPTNYEYIDAMYQNVLYRLPDQEGYDFWVGGMEAGLSREDILIAFTECNENFSNNIANLDDGVWVV